MYKVIPITYRPGGVFEEVTHYDVRYVPPACSCCKRQGSETHYARCVEKFHADVICDLLNKHST